VTINVIKKWQGTDKVSSDEIYKHFTATLRRTVNGKDYEILAKDFEVGKNFETKSFGPYPKYDKDGNEYTYEIIETKGSGNLYSWTGNDTQVKTGIAGSSSVVNLELVNTHPEVPEIPAVIEAEKVVESSTGTDQSKAGFEFGLYVKDDSTESGYRMLESKTTDATGKVSFTEIKYNENQVAEHVYYVHEIEPANRRAGFEAYDPNYYPVYVNVTYSDNTHTALKSEVRYGTEKSLAPVRITNKYNAKGTVKLMLSKDVQTASGNSYWPDGASFTFKVYDNDVYLEGKDVTISSTDPVTFESPSYNQAGPHTYRFEEVVPEEPTAIKYDATVKPVTVYFRDNNDGTLKPYDGAGNEANLIETGLTVDKFINHYDAKDSVSLSGIKRLDQGTVSDNKFRVSISRNGVALDTVPIVKNGDTGEWSYSEDFTLDDLDPVTRTATITYDVREDLTDKISGIIYDETSYTVTVKLSDENKNGKLVVSKTVQKNGEPSDVTTNALDFINTKPGDENVPILVTKTVPGTNIDDVDDGSFTFILKDDKGAELETKDYLKSEHGAKFMIRFDPAEIGTSEAPTKFEYTVLEKQPEGNDVKQVELGGVTYNYKDGFLYDPAPHTVSVNVWYSPAEKKLKSEVIYPEGDNKVVIHNPYVTEGEAKVCVGKQLVDYNDPETLIDDEYYPAKGFQFRLYDPETDTYSAVKTISANGEIAEFTAKDAPFLKYSNDTLKFGPNDEETYIKNETKYYWIEELPNEYGDAFVNDPEDRALVEVTLNEENGVINTTVNVKKTNNEEIKKAAKDLKGLFERLTGTEKKNKADVWFTNKVKKYGKLTLDGFKKVAYADGYKLDDEGFAEAAKTFGNLRFDVKVSNSKYDKSAVGTVDPKTGAITFDKDFEFDETGTYDVAISESWANGQKPAGAKYDLRWDKTPAKFKFDVTDANKDGIFEIGSPHDRNDNAADVKEPTGTNGEYNISFTCTNLLNMNWSIDKIFLGVGTNETLTAHLQLLDGKKVVDEWDATTNGKTVGPDGRVVYSHQLSTDKVKLGKTYTLHETAQPKDYVLADDVTVYIAKDGTYILNNDKLIRPMGNPIEMLNAKPDIKYTYVEISKTWEDPYDDTPEKRPTVYAQVYRKIKDSNDEFTKYGEPVIIAKQADGTYLARVDGLPANAYINNAYVDYEYKAEEIFTEEMKEAGYEKVDGNDNAYIGSTLSSTEENANTVRLHNKLEQRYIDIPVRKVWKDGKSAAVHPTITFHLIADGRDTGKKIDLPSGQLEGRFTKLPVYNFSAEKKHEIVYTVTEDPVAGYKPGQGVKNADGSWTFTNESIKTKIRKYDANDISAHPTELEGAVFTINKVGGGWSATLKSGQTLEYAIGSKGSGGILPGDYEMRETKAPYGYARSAVVAHFTVADDGTVTQTDKWVKSNWNKTDG
ncbi:MAG: Cna B-type domain-containing protein, partial [Lachnospiraceae bacterium]|nr:Cna B-type domain-containing protein [Lachnospiraceae bacterium]